MIEIFVGDFLIENVCKSFYHQHLEHETTKHWNIGRKQPLIVLVQEKRICLKIWEREKRNTIIDKVNIISKDIYKIWFSKLMMLLFQ